MLQGIAGNSLGIWVAHGEGQALFLDSSLLTRVTDRRLVPLRYTVVEVLVMHSGNVCVGSTRGLRLESEVSSCSRPAVNVQLSRIPWLVAQLRIGPLLCYMHQQVCG